MRFFLKDSYRSGLFLVLAVWGGYFINLWPRMLYWTEKGISAGWVGVWGDWAAHFAYASRFAYNPPYLWFSEHPLFADNNFTYPFLADALSGILIRMGINEVTAFILPSIITTFFLLVIFYLFYYYFLRSGFKAFVAITLFFTAGGLGFLFFLGDFINRPDLEKLIFPSKEYTHIVDQNIEYINHITAMLVPQRALLLAMPIAISLLLFLVVSLKGDFGKVSKPLIFLVGMFGGSLLIIHVHTFLAFIIFCSIFALFNLKYLKAWTLFTIGGILTSSLIYFLIYQNIDSQNFIRWQPGWIAASLKMNFFYFWLLNLGAFLPIAAFAIWKFKYYKNYVVVAAVFIFLLGNLILFQPYAFDNTKLFIYSYLIFCIPVTTLLARLWQKGLYFKILSISLFLLLSFSGLLDLIHITRNDKLSSLLWTNEDLQIASRFRQISQPLDRVLVSDQHNHWVSTLTGRQILLGYRGWMWTYGIDYNKREKDLKIMFEGKSDAKNLFKEYNIKYAVLGPSEIYNFGANNQFFSDNFPSVLKNETYTVYQIY